MMLTVLMYLSLSFTLTTTDSVNTCDSLFDECQAVFDTYEKQTSQSKCETLEEGLECLDKVNQSCSVHVIHRAIDMQAHYYVIFYKCDVYLNNTSDDGPTAHHSVKGTEQPAASRSAGEVLRPFVFSPLVTTTLWLLTTSLLLLAPTTFFT